MQTNLLEAVAEAGWYLTPCAKCGMPCAFPDPPPDDYWCGYCDDDVPQVKGNDAD